MAHTTRRKPCSVLCGRETIYHGKAQHPQHAERAISTGFGSLQYCSNRGTLAYGFDPSIAASAFAYRLKFKIFNLKFRG
uniref:Uncharacterized protein n=1 Tax=Oryza brachyantha TaxID=4533 RepID=J3KXL1_ORYBR